MGCPCFLDLPKLFLLPQFKSYGIRCDICLGNTSVLGSVCDHPAIGKWVLYDQRRILGILNIEHHKHPRKLFDFSEVCCGFHHSVLISYPMFS